MVDTSKIILLQLSKTEIQDIAPILLRHSEIPSDGLLEIFLPRFPRVRDVKAAVANRFGIPVEDQSLFGPLPEETELKHDWVFLHSLGVIPGLTAVEYKDSTHTESAVKNRSLDTGSLFSCVTPLACRQHKEGDLLSDVLVLGTRLPLPEYFPGGSFHSQRLRRAQRASLLLQALLCAALLGAVLYVLWLIPGYELPNIRPTDYSVLQAMRENLTQLRAADGTGGQPMAEGSAPGSEPLHSGSGSQEHADGEL
uniref:Uncharacterized protein n=1 Tax=Tetraselmis sp. GSL018 TaxID=582737 RepID=A0A061QXG5_9CHLO|mmetsp:Transcript_24036/g.57273  ORF Transcript_24036/g.57273 Transcript_24036/m.57273 type:complete len:253 (-) Transcript_24036:147-905(-)